MVLPLVILDCVFRALTDFLVIIKHRLHTRAFSSRCTCVPAYAVCSLSGLCSASSPLNKRCLKMVHFFFFIQAIFALPKSDGKAIGPANTSSVTGCSRRIFHIPMEYTVFCMSFWEIGVWKGEAPFRTTCSICHIQNNLSDYIPPYQSQAVTAQLFPLVASLYGHN